MSESGGEIYSLLIPLADGRLARAARLRGRDRRLPGARPDGRRAALVSGAGRSGTDARCR